MTLENAERREWNHGGGHLDEGFESYVSPAHGGPCAMNYRNRCCSNWAIFPEVP